MSAPLCVHCANDPMLEKFRVHILEKVRVHIPAGNKQLVVYQCDGCKRIQAVTE